MGLRTRTSGIARVFTKCYPVATLSLSDESGYLGASPDGIVVDEAGHSIKLVEVKCPFSARDMTVKEACTEANHFVVIIIINNKCQLNVNHEYYFQVMGQMAITGVHTCDFVVWTTKDFYVQTINFDSDLWINTCLPKLISSLCSLKSCIPICLLLMIIQTTSVMYSNF